MSTTSSQPSPTPHLTTLLLLSLPPQTFISLDLFSFTTPSTSTTSTRTTIPSQPHPSFHGIKLIPAGIHHLTISPGPLSDFSPRSGLWFYSSGVPGSVICFNWNERVGELSLVEEDEERFDEVICGAGGGKGKGKEVWVRWWYEGGLVEYRSRGGSGVQEVGDSRIWKALVGELGEGTLGRVVGKPEEGTGGVGVGVKVWRVESESSAGQDLDDEILNKIPLPSSGGEDDYNDIINNDNSTGVSTTTGAALHHHDQTLNLLPIDLKRTFPPNATGRERTIAAQDRSWYLNYLGTAYLLPYSQPAPPDYTITQIDSASREILGELELTFIEALMLSNYSCAEAYVRTLTLCLTCEERIFTNPGFYHQLLEVLITQFGVGLDCFAPPDAVGAGREEEGRGGETEGEGVAWAPDWLTEGANPVPKLLRGFLRTLKRLLVEAELEEDRKMLEGLLGKFGGLEEVVEGRFGWVVDSSKVVKRGMVMLEDGEMVELELAGLLGEEEDEEGDGPVVVEL